MSSIPSPPSRPPVPPSATKHFGIPEWIGFIWSGLCGLLWFAITLAGGHAFAPSLVVLLIWAGPAFCLLIIYLIGRAGRGRCRVCGSPVGPGLPRCGGCSHDFAAAASGRY